MKKDEIVYGISKDKKIGGQCRMEEWAEKERLEREGW